MRKAGQGRFATARCANHDPPAHSPALSRPILTFSLTGALLFLSLLQHGRDQATPRS